MEIDKIRQELLATREAKKLSFAKIATMANVPTSTVTHFFSETRETSFNNVSKIAKSLGYDLVLKKKNLEGVFKIKRLNAGEKQMLIDLYNEGNSYIEIASILNLSLNKITNRVHLLKLKGLIDSRRNFDIDKSKVLELYKKGFVTAEIAKQNNCSPQTIYKIRLVLLRDGYLEKETKTGKINIFFKDNSQKIKEWSEDRVPQKRMLEKLDLQITDLNISLLRTFLKDLN